MLSRALMLRSCLPRFPRSLKSSRHYSSAEVHPEVLVRKEVRLSSHIPKQPQRSPFAKNFFMGKYDIEFAAFPEPQTIERHKEFFDWLAPIEDYVKTVDMKKIDETGVIPEEVLDNLATLGVFRALVPEEYKGLGLNVSEYSKLVETLSYVPVLGALLSKQAVAVTYINDFASDEQKHRYLPRIATGELEPTVCITEDREGQSDTAILAQAKPSICDTYYMLNGTKTCVVNAKTSDIFIVICDASDAEERRFKEPEAMSAFIVERQEGIIAGPPAKTVGFKGLDLCEVKFENVKIPAENLIGQVGDAGANFKKIFAEGKQYIGAQAIGITRRFLNTLVAHLKENKDFNELKFKNHAIQQVVGKTAGALYGMESAVYLTSGMMDNFEEQDVEMEKCMIEIFCAEECIHWIFQGLQIIGISAQVEDQLFQQFLRDALCLLSFDGTVINTQMFVSMLGLQFIGNQISEQVKKSRNPLYHPLFILRRMLKLESTPHLYIADNLHPSLKPSAQLLEYGIARLKDCLEKWVVLHGREVTEKQAAHRRIAEFSTCLFVMASILARTSRSYCLGMRDAGQEVYLTQVYAYVLYERIRLIIEQLNDAEWINGDIIVREISDNVFEKDGYFLAHPLARNGG